MSVEFVIKAVPLQRISEMLSAALYIDILNTLCEKNIFGIFGHFLTLIEITVFGLFPYYVFLEGGEAN